MRAVPEAGRRRSMGPGALRATGLALLLLVATGVGVGAQQAESYKLTLGDAARLAADRAAPVRAAEARMEGAEARVRDATSELLPGVDVYAAWGSHTLNTASFGLEFPTAPGEAPLFEPGGEVVGPVRSADARVSLEVPLLDLGALGRRSAAQAAAGAAQDEVAVAAQRAAVTAGRAYLAVLRAREGVAAREDDLALARELTAVARSLRDAGVAVAIDVTRAEAQAATARAQLLTARQRRDVAELALRRSLRLSEEASLELVDSLGSRRSGGPRPSRDEAIARALDARPELAVTSGYRAAATHLLAGERATRLPRISASLDRGFYGPRFGHMLPTYSWSVTARVPLFDGFSRSAHEEEQRARIHELDHRLADQREDVVFEVRSALQRLKAADERVAAAEEWRRLAELELEQERARLAAGASGTRDVVQSALRLNEASTARLDALWSARSTRLELAAAMGSVVDLP